ncbi:glycosyltransferase family 2 protein [Piromyces sp. E2]|nr:glycosyltransferase family 2 protein [Piromyces sp. E2]|eukprot:OUM61951.1 glycosyltransferase family 2 protein [Piromyces sp. E2]
MAKTCTCYIPNACLNRCHKTDRDVQQAWREKVTLCIIILCVCLISGFFTFGINMIICNNSIDKIHYRDSPFSIHGVSYDITITNYNPDSRLHSIIGMSSGHDLGQYFLSVDSKSECNQIMDGLYGQFSCSSSVIGNLLQEAHRLNKSCYTMTNVKSDPNISTRKIGNVYYTWKDLEDLNDQKNLVVYNGNVLDVTDFLAHNHTSIGNNLQDILRSHNALDVTYSMSKNTSNKKAIKCMNELYKVGTVGKTTSGCIIGNIILALTLIFVTGVIFIKFCMALIFSWFLKWPLGDRYGIIRKIAERERRITPKEPLLPKDPSGDSMRMTILNINLSNGNIVMPKYPNPFKAEPVSQNNSFSDLTSLKRNSITNWDPTNTNSPTFNSVLNKKGTVSSTPPLGNIFNSQVMNSPSLLANSNNPLINGTIKTMPEPTLPNVGILDDELPPSSPPLTNNSTIKDLLHTILLVTCYSEGHDGIANTLDSLANTDYPDSLKLIIVICDGLVKGEGNDGLTSDIVIDMIDPGDGSNYHDHDQEAKSYVAIAEGEKRHNMAKIYSGWYRYALNETGRRIPMIGIVKCGTEQERYGLNKSTKPGNRGKRDSQVLLLGFLSRVLFNDRMTELDFDLFTKIYELTGVHADGYESIMMVDADTVVDKNSLAHLTACLIQDPKIMGLCGETKIGNKTQSWVTMIQVFEYYISHHMSKAFESVFGGVTCLPGCFCMYRIKSKKGDHGYWVPILANPEIVEQYSENIVHTLHKKNLLLLGEDRYLSTLMLREFPKRKMVFVPQATCHTIVPSEFRVLLSQRRRWINSTIHNLLELVLVNDLCGTFCISMQFVVFMELIGTMVLPAAIIFTYYLIINAIFSSQKHIFTLCLMAAIMGLPAILIALTSRKIRYILWMIVYLLALPVWNFILPVYAFWHFDDFSWGQTRVVEGEIADKSGRMNDGKFDSTGIIMKKWEEWEKLRRAGIIITENKEGDLGDVNNYYNNAPDITTMVNTNNNSKRLNSFNIPNISIHSIM